MSVYDKAKELTVTQVEVMLLGEKGMKLVNNEGKNFRVWMEYEGRKVDYTLRNITAEILLGRGLFINSNTRKYENELSDLGKRVLDKVDNKKVGKAKNSLKRKGMLNI